MPVVDVQPIPLKVDAQYDDDEVTCIGSSKGIVSSNKKRANLGETESKESKKSKSELSVMQ